MSKRCPTWTSTLLLATAVAACSAPTRYMHPNADLGNIQKVAVLPFDNVTADKAAGIKVHEVFLIELLSTRAFEVAEPGLVNRALRDIKADSAANLTPDDFKKLGAALKVHGFFVGSLLDFADNRSGGAPAPEVTLQLRLIEARTGLTVWAASETRSGAGIGARLFGIGDESLTRVAQGLIRRQFDTLLVE